MTKLQEDLLSIYNTLVMFNETLTMYNPKPIKVWYEPDSKLLVFEQKNKSARLYAPIYYTLGLEDLVKPTYLLPNDYDALMYNLQSVINSGILLKDRTILSPENFGFDIYATEPKELHKGPEVVGKMRFISGTSWLFKKYVEFKYKL